MGLFRIIYKLTLIIIIILTFFLTNSALSLIFILAPFKRRKLLTTANAFYAKLVLKVLNIEVSLSGPSPQKGALVIGNHMSYLDILIYFNFFETLFVTSVDMRNRLLLGQITVLGGCLYVERRNPRHLPNELKALKKFFDKGFSVCVFPEGTSTNGETVLPFKKSLFQLAFQTKAPIQPIVLKYSLINNKPFSHANRDLVCWYGNLAFIPHLIKLLQVKSVKVSLTSLPAFDPTPFTDRKALAEHTHRLILEHYQEN